MGSNMQRQAVPLLRAEAPLVGTGMEETVARDFGAAIAARRSGIVDQVDATRIVVRATGDRRSRQVGRRHLHADEVPALEPEHLHQPASAGEGRRRRSRPATSSPTVRRPSSASSRSAATCSSRSCRGTATTTRTSILISERIVKDDVFTSIHIEEFEVMARDTKLGPEDITRDIPNVGEEALRNLDEAGIVYIGAEVEPGDILVRQDHAEGRKPDDAGGEAAPRHLRREGVGRARHLAAAAAGRHRHDRRGARVQPPRHRHRRPYARDPDRGESIA